MNYKATIIAVGTLTGALCTVLIIGLWSIWGESASSEEWGYWIVWGIMISIVNGLFSRWLNQPKDHLIEHAIVILGMVIFGLCVGMVFGRFFLDRAVTDWDLWGVLYIPLYTIGGGMLIGVIIGLFLIKRRATFSKPIWKGIQNGLFGIFIGFVLGLLYLNLGSDSNFEVIWGYGLVKGIFASGVTGLIITLIANRMESQTDRSQVG